LRSAEWEIRRLRRLRRFLFPHLRHPRNLRIKLPVRRHQISAIAQHRAPSRRFGRSAACPKPQRVRTHGPPSNSPRQPPAIRSKLGQLALPSSIRSAAVPAAAREQSSPHPKNPTLSGLAKRLRVRTPALPPIVQPKMNTGKEPLKCGTAERMAHEFRRCPSF